jgi:hypothetical protein
MSLDIILMAYSLEMKNTLQKFSFQKIVVSLMFEFNYLKFGLFDHFPLNVILWQ